MFPQSATSIDKPTNQVHQLLYGYSPVWNIAIIVASHGQEMLYYYNKFADHEKISLTRGIF